MRRVGFLVLVLVALCSLGAAQAAAATWYVSSGGGDDGYPGGDPGQPFATIGKALSVAASGDVVLVAGGAYSGDNVVSALASLTVQGGWSADFSAHDPAAYPSQLVGAGTDATGNHIAFNCQDTADVRIEGFTITNYFRGLSVYDTDAVGLAVTAAGNVFDANYDGIVIDLGVVVADGNLFLNNSYAGINAAYGSSSNVTAVRNEFLNNGIGISSSRGQSVIYNNIIRSTGYYNILLNDHCGSNVMNNTLIGPAQGIAVNYYCSAYAYNNIIVGASQYAVLKGTGASVYLRTNLLYRNAVNYSYTGYFAGSSGDVFANPLLDADHRLTAYSPAINAGTDVSAQLDADIDGDPRTPAFGGDGHFDIGADEFMTTGIDADGDGFPSGSDCNDANGGIRPGAAELCDGLDNNCDGQIDILDDDGDGYSICSGGDCNDVNPAIRPGATELCDGVDNDCNDQIDDGFGTLEVCASGCPFATIQSAVDVASSCQTVLVGAGTYYENLNLGPNRVNLKGAGATETIIDGSAPSDSTKASVVTVNLGAVIEDLTIRNGRGTLVSGYRYGAGIYAPTASPFIRNCTITGNIADVGNDNRSSGGGIYAVAPTIVDSAITFNEAHASGGGIFATAPVVINSLVADNSANWGSGMYISGGTIRNSVIRHNGYGGIMAGWGVGVQVDRGAPEFTNCLITENQGGEGSGIRSYQAQTKITNCTIANNGGSGLSMVGGGTTTVVNSVVWNGLYFLAGGTLNASYSDILGGYAGTGNINADPQFVNAAGGDFRLGDTSPCRDVGTPFGAPGTDLAGTARPQGVKVDLGAYEWVDADGDGYGAGTDCNDLDQYVNPGMVEVEDLVDNNCDGHVDEGFNPPTAADDAYGTDEDVPLSVPAPGVLGNDTDIDGDPLGAVLEAGPAHGTLTLNPDGSFVYTPAANYNGSDSFTYRASDVRKTSGVATVSIAITPVNDPPVANAGPDQSGQILQVLSFSGAGSSDIDSTILTYSWNWGDNTPAGSGVDATHAYAIDGTYTVTLTVTDNLGQFDTDTAQVTVTLPPNLALNKPASASSTRSATYAPAKAVDGSRSTSWMSNKTNGSQWLQVDLQANYSFSFVRVFWPATYYARAFQIQTSTDGTTFTTRYSATGATGTPTKATFATVSARYVRIAFTTPNNSSYYGVAELEVYAVPLPNIAPVANAGTDQTGNVGKVLNFSGAASADTDGTIVSYSWNWGDNTANGTGVSATHVYAAVGTYTVTLTVTDDQNAIGTGTTVITVNPAPVNLALNKPASASTTRGAAYAAAMAVDGSTSTSWMSSTTSGAQWVLVDLGSSLNISNIKVTWPATYYARDFQIQTSTDGTTWTSRHSATGAAGTVTNATFATVSARYVRVYCTRRNNSSYYGVAELEVYQ